MNDPRTTPAVPLAAGDRGLLWHPYAPLDGPSPYAVTAASGSRLTLQTPQGQEREVVDAMASWWCAIHGYRHPVLDAALHERIDTFSHVMFGGLTHEPAIALAERLTDMAPGMSHVFLADSGSVSVEVALKLALQHAAAQGHPRRQHFLTVRGGYHGDTFAAMSVCDPVDGMHSLFPGAVAQQRFAPRPPGARHTLSPAGEDVWEVDEAALTHWQLEFRHAAHQARDEIAAVIVEPVLQGAGGMHVYHPDALRTMREVCDELDILLIADEIATGFGRTGRLFACEWAEVTPDVMCVGKALTGGYLTLAAVLVTREVGEVITRSQFRALLHGPTFMGNPLACAAAGASLGLLAQGTWRDDVRRIERGLVSALAPARELATVQDVRTLGAVGVVQLDRPVDVTAVTAAAVERGVWVRPFRDLVYTMPPYVSSDEDIAAIGAAIVGAIGEVHE